MYVCVCMCIRCSGAWQKKMVLFDVEKKAKQHSEEQPTKEKSYKKTLIGIRVLYNEKKRSKKNSRLSVEHRKLTKKNGVCTVFFCLFDSLVYALLKLDARAYFTMWFFAYVMCTALFFTSFYFRVYEHYKCLLIVGFSLVEHLFSQITFMFSVFSRINYMYSHI